MMKIKALLVNPWIYDFAAVDLWARPLGLLRVAEWLSGFDIDLTLIDCTDAGERKKYGRRKYPKEVCEKPECLSLVPRRYGRYGMAIEDFKTLLKQTGPFDIVFMTSIMSYWYPGVQKAIEIIRTMYCDIPVVLGGIYATLWNDHASACSGADFIYRGHIDQEMRFVFNTFGFRVGGKKVKTPYYELGLYREYPFAPLLTGTGCPFHCAYCASSVLNEKFMQRDPAESAQEIIEFCGRGTGDFVFYDDALLVNPDAHLKVLLRKIIRAGVRARFHCPNGLHAGLLDDEVAGLMKQAGFMTIRLGFETADRVRQGRTGGKVTSGDLQRAVTLLKGKGFSKKDIGVYLMYGLPGQDLEEVCTGVEFLKSLGVKIHLAEFSPIPGTQSWTELIQDGIIDDSIDPLLTNNSVFSYLYSGYAPEKLAALKLQVKDFNR